MRSSINLKNGYAKKYLDGKSTAFFVTLSFVQYFICRFGFEPQVGTVWAHLLFLPLFAGLIAHYLWDEKITLVGKRIWEILDRKPELWFFVRFVIEILTVFFLLLFFFKALQTYYGAPVRNVLFDLLLGLYFIDGLVVFIAYYSQKDGVKYIQDNVAEIRKKLDALVKRDRIKDVFYFTTALSVFLKTLTTVLLVLGVTGAINLGVSIIVVITPYLILSLILTSLWITGSFQATVRYWEWLLTEPPKMVIRFLFKINRDKVNCHDCGRPIPLVDKYTCSRCGFTYKGNLFDWCPSCYTRFDYVNCTCGLSRKRPLFY